LCRCWRLLLLAFFPFRLYRVPLERSMALFFRARPRAGRSFFYHLDALTQAACSRSVGRWLVFPCAAYDLAYSFPPPGPNATNLTVPFTLLTACFRHRGGSRSLFSLVVEHHNTPLPALWRGWKYLFRPLHSYRVGWLFEVSPFNLG